MKPFAASPGRPKGSRPIDRAALVQAFNRAVEPFAEELMQRAVALPMSGDRETLAGLLALIGAAMQMSDRPPTVKQAG